MAQGSSTQGNATTQYSQAQLSYMKLLDQLLADRDDGKLASELLGKTDYPMALAGLDWARDRLKAGAGLPVQLLYVRDLWRLGTDQNESLRETASLITLYTVGVVLADGVKCADKTATEMALNRFLDSQSFMLTLQLYKHLPKDKQDLYLVTAVRMEASTAPRRSNDEYLCRWGVENFDDYEKKHGNAGVTEGPSPDGVGTTKLYPVDPTYHPRFLSPEEWKPAQVSMRPQLSNLITAAISHVTARMP